MTVSIADLVAVIRADDRGEFERLLDGNPELASARDERGGDSPLLIAIYWHRPAMVRLLLDRGVRPSFFEACALGLGDEVGRHLRENAGLARQWAHDGWTPLHLAAFFGHPTTAAMLLEKGADLMAISRNGEANLPINAAAAGRRVDRHVEIVRLLIERGCPVDGRGSDRGHTALHEAAYNGDIELVRFLLDRGADPSLRTGDGQTALDVARDQHKHEVVRLLGG
jgi:uncharacterized protein